jgi:transcriptional regulator with PAS, ATPase and Fis domain
MSANPADSVSLVRQLPENPSVILLVDDDRAEQQSDYLAAGVDCVLYSGLRDEALSGAIEAELTQRLRVVAPTPARGFLAEPQLSDFQSDEPAMRRFLEMAHRVARTDSSVLILGETGVGKEHLAKAIHAGGKRQQGPFVAINCGALPESLMESELFGHDAGAFTGAARGRRGCFEQAHGGTVFLDEIAEMPVHLQVKLLRVLQDQEIRRLGSERSLHVDVRIMAATNRDPVEEVREGRFRRDLFYRLGVVTLTLPPLRDRRLDIPPLVKRTLDVLKPRLGIHAASVPDPVLKVLVNYDWPGNVRELSNILERALLLSDHGAISLGCLPTGLDNAMTRGRLENVRRDAIPDEWLSEPLPALCEDIIAQVEKAYLRAWLERTRGRVGRVAEAAGVQTRTLYEKMKLYQLDKADFRRSG